MEFLGCGVFALFGLVMMAAGVASVGIWIWMLIDCVTKEPEGGNEKLTWILVIVFAGAIGGAIYYFVRRPERIRLYGQ